jgi:hypothetical protein
MTGTGTSSPFIKAEPDDQLFGSNQRFMNSNPQFGMNHQQFNHFDPSGTNGSINPNDLSMPVGSFMGGGFQGSFGQSTNPNASFSKGMSSVDDDDLLDDSLFNSIDPNGMQNGIHNNQQDFNSPGFDNFDLINGMYPGQTPAISMDHHSHMNNVYSSTPDGDPIQSPFIHNFNQQHMRQMQQHQFGSSMQSPTSYAGSPLATEMHVGSADGFMNAKARVRPSLTMQRKPSSNARSPLTPKTPGVSVGSLNIGGPDQSVFQTQPIHAAHRKTPSANQWEQSVGSLQSFPGSAGFSPLNPGMHPNQQISEMLKAGSMPAKLNGVQSSTAPAMQTQEMKRRRRRESHNLVERRRRDNINERIQELSHLVPMHRLEDEKVRKALQNNAPLSPLLGASGVSPPQATSGLAGPGARRAAAGTITQGIPVEEKDKGPNKGDILNGSVSWTRDLMWMLHVKLQQQEELANYIAELGGKWPFEPTEEEKRMQTELLDAVAKNGVSSFSYSRAPGTGLRVPKHTDIRGDAINKPAGVNSSLSPDDSSNQVNQGLTVGGQYWSGNNSGESGPGSISFKEEDEYGMDLTQ